MRSFGFPRHLPCSSFARRNAIVPGSRFAAAALLACLAFAAAPAGAETRELDGAALIFSHFVDVPVAIAADPSLHHRVRIVSEGSSDCLNVMSAGAVTINTERCGGVDGTIRIDVAPDIPLTVTQSGSGDISIGDMVSPVVISAQGSGDIKGGTSGALVVTMRGSANVTFGAVNGPLKLDMAGSGDMRVRSVDGPLMVQHRGSGDVAVGHVEAPVVDMDGAGSGDVLLGAGHVRQLQVRIAGDGDFAFAGETQDANLKAAGGGDIKLGKVTGTVQRSAIGGSDIMVGGPAVVDSIVGKVASEISQGDGTGHTVIVGGSGLQRHIAEIVVFGVLAFIIWRVARRGGFRRPSASMPGQPVPSHPGVVAVNDTLRRVEARLGRVEGYVTSREFELQQKFKKL